MLEADREVLQGVLRADIFSGFSSWKAIAYERAPDPKLLQFTVTDLETARPLYLAAIISRDEKMIWQSFQDLLGRAVDLARGSMQGLFGLEVLAVNLQDGIRHFDAGDLSRLLINHSKELAPGSKALIRYGQLFCLLHKRVSADWGKIEAATHVEIVDPEKIRKENFIKKILKKSGGDPGAIYLVQDLSAVPVWGVTEEAGGRIAGPEIYFFYSSLKALRRFIPEV